MKRIIFLVLMIFSSQLVIAQYDASGNVQIANSTEHEIRVKVGFNDGMDCGLDEWRTVCIAPWSSSIVGVEGKLPYTTRIWKGCLPDPATHSYHHNTILTPGCDAPTLANPYSVNWNYYMGTWGITIYI